jgi:hypothetical protein
MAPMRRIAILDSGSSCVCRRDTRGDRPARGTAAIAT